jgi:hypothetical protein
LVSLDHVTPAGEILPAFSFGNSTRQPQKMAASSGAQKVFLQKRTPGLEAKPPMAADTGMDYHPSNTHWNIY